MAVYPYIVRPGEDIPVAVPNMASGRYEQVTVSWTANGADCSIRLGAPEGSRQLHDGKLTGHGWADAGDGEVALFVHNRSPKNGPAVVGLVETKAKV